MTTVSPETAGGLADLDDARANCGLGLVMDLDGGTGHDVVADALELLENLEHRGATGAEENTGDGAGVVLQHPHEFFAAELADTGVGLPAAGEYAVGQLFLPTDDDAAGEFQNLFEDALAEHGLTVRHWRTVPTDNADLGKTALDSEPTIVQAFVVPDADIDGEAFDRALYLSRRAAEKAIKASDIRSSEQFYVCSLDRRTVVYKGLLKATQLSSYFPDLTDERVESTFALVHARFSTNTLGAWHLAHPYRKISHNGEINTIQGNANWMRARESDLESEMFGDEIEELKPIVADPEGSDTAMVDNVLELLVESGRDLPHALRMLVPEAWRNDELMDDARRDFYDFHASLVEPWDGPALVAATDGERVAAVLDRNGLRPCRYEVTTDNRLVMASEVGALESDPSEVRERGRLEPGQLFLADPTEGRIIPDEEVFEGLTDEDYGKWIDREQVALGELADDSVGPAQPVEATRAHQRTHGYTHDELSELLGPMATDGKDPIGSMGDDTPLSVLSDFNRTLDSYFKQLFAQVSNPPIDYIREEVVTSLESRLGRQRNLLDESSTHARQIVVDSPILTDAELATLGDEDATDLEARSIDITYSTDGDLETAVERVREDVLSAVADGAEIVILSDRETGPDRLPIPSLLATGSVHHHLVREGLRTNVGLVIESGDPRTVHQIATLVGYGAGAVNPYLAIQTIADEVADREGVESDEAVEHYVHALETGLLKVMSKMGISTVESYQGAQIFEAVGLDSDFVAEYFEGTVARTGGVGVAEVEDDLRERHDSGFGDDDLERQGEFRHRNGGVFHQWNPQTVGTLQKAVRQGDYEVYQEFAETINDQATQLQTLRGLLEFDSARESIPLDVVEPVESIVQRFSTAAMSLGSLSPEAHENNAIAMNRIGGKANTGEGGEPSERFGTERNCAIKQVASGRFGVTSDYLASADDLQIKMAQGSKPGEGGQLPGHKVDEMIASVRCATPGVELISPPPQHDIYSIEDLKQLIYDLRAANPDARVHVKLVSEAGIGTIAAGVAKADADCVHISGHSGGTGASPRTSIKHAGLPWELGLSEANQLLRETGLRSRITVRVDGGLKTGRDVAVAALLGGEEFAFGTASLVTSGCVMARQCQNNTCPVGIATQTEKLRGRFPGEPDNVINYMTFIAQELREIMADLGFRSVEEMVGRVEALRQCENVEHPKARHVDLSAVLAEPAGDERTNTRQERYDLGDRLDDDLIEAAKPALIDGKPVEIDHPISNVDRAVGTTLSGKISEVYDSEGLPDDTITCQFSGTAGQSFGAFLASGVSAHLEGPANDYLGKGLSGGKISVRTPASAPYEADENILVGNVALYGATGGECYVNGVAGERFAVRNSAAMAVVEGVGDHACEYMTGGAVAVLGETGTNFAAGMSGGVAYVLDDSDEFESRVNAEMVQLETGLGERDEAMLRRLVENHLAYTGSEKARQLLDNWEAALSKFVKVMPSAYRQAVNEHGREDVRDSPPASASVVVSNSVVAPPRAD